jgi:hypothetical protein
MPESPSLLVPPAGDAQRAAQLRGGGPGPPRVRPPRSGRAARLGRPGIPVKGGAQALPRSGQRFQDPRFWQPQYHGQQRHQRGDSGRAEQAGPRGGHVWHRDAPRDVLRAARARVRVQAGGDPGPPPHQAQPGHRKGGRVPFPLKCGNSGPFHGPCQLLTPPAVLSQSGCAQSGIELAVSGRRCCGQWPCKNNQ